MYEILCDFRAFDHNGDGSISRDELRDAMRRFGHTLSKEECDEMFQVRFFWFFRLKRALLFMYIQFKARTFRGVRFCGVRFHGV